MALFVMTGESGSGKTRWIERLLGRAARCAAPVHGVYTPAVFGGGEKTAIDACLLPQGERMRFARRRSTTDAVHGLGWDFDPSATERMNGHIADFSGEGLLVVDELGPLELVRGEGLTAALGVLDAGAFEHALVVVRPSLVDAARKRWGEFELLTPRADIALPKAPGTVSSPLAARLDVG